jgi:multidrug efflux pump subunit AcrA (membrane-fusion protein)
MKKNYIFHYISFIFLALFLIQCKSKNQVIKPLRKDITQAVFASGKIYPIQRKIIASKVAGYIEKIHVGIGQIVEANQPLLTIKNEISDVSVNTAKNNYDFASANADDNSALLKSAEEDVKNAKIKYELDSVNYLRFDNLYKGNATSKLNLDQAKALAESSKQTLLKAKQQVANLKLKLENDVKNARSNYESQKLLKSDYVLYAENRAKIYDIRPRLGDLIAPQIPLVELGNVQSFEVELAIDETDIGLVKEGQRIIYEIEALKNQTFEGKVVQLYPVVNPLNKTAKVIASIEVKENTNFFSGMSVEANIVVAEKKQALVIPKNFLYEQEFVKKADNQQKVKITKGIEDLEYVEIVNGIDANTEISD